MNSKKSFLDKIEQYLTSNSDLELTLEEFIELMLVDFGYKHKSLDARRKILIRRMHNAPYELTDDLTEGDRRAYINWVRLFHLLYKFDYRKFGVPNEVLFSKSKKFSNQKTSNIISRSVSLQFDYNVHKQVERFIASYEAMITPIFNKIRKSILIYEYLESAEHKNPFVLEPYYEILSKYYDGIENLLKTKKDFVYTRFLALPFEHTMSKFSDPDNDTDECDLLVGEILNIISVPLFKHIVNCLFMDYDRFSGLKSGFIIVQRCTRLHKWIILDENEYLITETYRSNRKMKIVPDFLNVKSITEQNIEKIDEYIKDKRTFLDNSSDPKCPRLTFKGLDVLSINQMLESKLQETINDLILFKSRLKNSKSDTKYKDRLTLADAEHLETKEQYIVKARQKLIYFLEMTLRSREEPDWTFPDLGDIPYFQLENRLTQLKSK